MTNGKFYTFNYFFQFCFKILFPIIFKFFLYLGTFRALSDVILNDLSEREQEALVNHVRDAVAQFEVQDLALLLPLLLSNTSIQEAVLKTVITFVTNEMRLTLVD